MTNTALTVVTGANGRTGSVVARCLLAAGLPVRVLVRNAAKARDWRARGAQVALADFHDAPALRAAFAGAGRAYIVSPESYDREDLFSHAQQTASGIARAAVEAGISSLVALSSCGADRETGSGCVLMNRMLEQSLIATGLNVTLLRAAYFIENWLPPISDTAASGTLCSFLAPVTQKMPMVAAEDIGQTAAALLQESWQGVRLVELEGPARYSPQDVAQAIGQATSKPVMAMAIPEAEWAARLSQQGLSAAAQAGFAEMTRAFNQGYLRFKEDDSHDHRVGKITLDARIAQAVAAMPTAR